MATLRHKPGDTFDYNGVIKLNDTQDDMTGWTIRAQLRMDNPSRTFIDELVCTWTDITQGFAQLYRSKEDTARWLPCNALLDVQLQDADGFAVSTDTHNVQIIEGVTR